jgi:hypothetical protein
MKEVVKYNFDYFKLWTKAFMGFYFLGVLSTFKIFFWGARGVA